MFEKLLKHCLYVLNAPPLRPQAGSRALPSLKDRAFLWDCCTWAGCITGFFPRLFPAAHSLCFGCWWHLWEDCEGTGSMEGCWGAAGAEQEVLQRTCQPRGCHTVSRLLLLSSALLEFPGQDEIWAVEKSSAYFISVKNYTHSIPHICEFHHIRFYFHFLKII